MSEDGSPKPTAKRPGREPRAPLPKRFYKAARAEPSIDGAGFRVTLDGRTVRTPAKRALAVPTRALAEAQADEWRAQSTHIDPATMPLTRLVNTAIDGVAEHEAEVRADIVEYAGSDLVCYFAPEPATLTARQRKAWAPIHQWAQAQLGVRLALAEGVMPVTQDAAMLARIARALAGCDAFALAALHVMTTLTGSALISLAYMHGHIDAAHAWSLAHVDEDFQIEQWGADTEATARRERRWTEMDAAARLLGLLGDRAHCSDAGAEIEGSALEHPPKA